MDVVQSHTLSLIFTIAVVASIVLQACVVVGLFIVVRKAILKLTKVTELLSSKALPLVGNVQSIVQDLTPKVRTVSSQVVDITDAVHRQTQHVSITVDDVVNRTHAQAVRVDSMVSAVLGSISHAGATVQSGVVRPVRRAGGLLHGLRVGMETLFGGSRTERYPESYAHSAQPGTTARPRASVVAEDLDETLHTHAAASAPKPID